MDTASNTLRRSLGSTLAIVALLPSAAAIAQVPDDEAPVASQTIAADPATAAAELAVSEEASALAVPEQETAPQAEAKPALFGGGPVGDELLAKTSGREQSTLMLANSSNVAKVANNEVGDNSTTGDVNVRDSAFQNLSGISMVNFNTGNNSSINAAMSVNLQINFAPAP